MAQLCVILGTERIIPGGIHDVHRNVAHLDGVAQTESRRCNSHAVDERSVPAIEIVQIKRVAFAPEFGVPARYRAVHNANVTVACTADCLPFGEHSSRPKRRCYPVNDKPDSIQHPDFPGFFQKNHPSIGKGAQYPD